MAYLDKYGTVHNNKEEMQFANICYDMMSWLMENKGLNFVVQDAERLTAMLIEESTDGSIARARFGTFIEITERHHKSLHRKEKPIHRKGKPK